ncbi:MAG: pseudouridine synthase, partial [Paracoccaceae bacterium]
MTLTDPAIPPPGPDTYAPPTDPLVILHHDHELLLVDKPPGLLSVPGKGDHLADCLIARVQAVFPEALLVHRLDRDTSGVMVFALTRHAQRHLGLQFEKKQMKKTYIARVWSHVAEKTGTID